MHNTTVLLSLLLTNHSSTQPQLHRRPRDSPSVHNVSVAFPRYLRSPHRCDQNLVLHLRRSRTGSQPWQWNRVEVFPAPPQSSLLQSVKSLAPLMTVLNRRPHVIKTVGPVSWAHFSSTEPAGRNPPRSCQTLGQTLLGTGDAENTRIQSRDTAVALYLSLFLTALTIPLTYLLFF